MISALQQNGRRRQGGPSGTEAQLGLHVLLLTFIGSQGLRLCGFLFFFFYRFISADEVCLLLYPGLSPQRGAGLVSFVLIGKTVRLNPRALIITVYLLISFQLFFFSPRCACARVCARWLSKPAT